MMFRLKACPRCRGDLREDRDKYGNYANCLQCGYHQSDSRDLVPPSLPLVNRRGRPRKAMLESSLNKLELTGRSGGRGDPTRL